VFDRLDVLSDVPPFDREENTLELRVLVTEVDCGREEVTLEAIVLVTTVGCELELVVMVGAEVWSPLLVRRKELVCREAEL
jgi:hypothetical protein